MNNKSRKALERKGWGMVVIARESREGFVFEFKEKESGHERRMKNGSGRREMWRKKNEARGKLLKCYCSAYCYGRSISCCSRSYISFIAPSVTVPKLIVC